MLFIIGVVICIASLVMTAFEAHLIKTGQSEHLLRRRVCKALKGKPVWLRNLASPQIRAMKKKRAQYLFLGLLQMSGLQLSYYVAGNIAPIVAAGVMLIAGWAIRELLRLFYGWREISRRLERGEPW